MGSSTILFALLEHRVRKMSRMEGRGDLIYSSILIEGEVNKSGWQTSLE